MVKVRRCTETGGVGLLITGSLSVARVRWCTQQDGSSMGPVKNEFAFLRVVLMQRPAIARREEGAHRQYSTPVKNGLTPPASGWIDDQKCEVILDRAKVSPDVASPLQ